MVSVPNCYNEEIYRGLAGHACLSVQTHVWEIRAVCSSVCTCVWLKEDMGLFEGFDKCVGGTPFPSSMPIAEVNTSTSLLRISGPWEAERLFEHGKRWACGTPATGSQAWPCGCAPFCSLTFSTSSCLCFPCCAHPHQCSQYPSLQHAVLQPMLVLFAQLLSVEITGIGAIVPDFTLNPLLARESERESSTGVGEGREKGTETDTHRESTCELRKQLRAVGVSGSWMPLSSSLCFSHQMGATAAKP